MNLAAAIRRRSFLLPRSVHAFHFMLTRFPDFIGLGGVLVETRFRFRPKSGDEAKEFAFRTTIQLDGDVVNILTSPDYYAGDPDWRRLYDENYRMHLGRIERPIAQLERTMTHVAWLAGTLLSLFSTFTVWSRHGTVITPPHPAAWMGNGALLVAFVLGAFLLHAIFRRVLPRLVFALIRRRVAGLVSPSH